MLARVLGHDRPVDLLHAAAFFVAYWVVDLTARLVSGLDERAAAGASLVLGAVGLNTVWWVAPIVAAVALAVRSRARLAARWDALDHGRVLRWLALPPLVLLGWQGALYEYNYLADQAHVVDRVLVVALAAGAWYRPAFLAPFVIQSRIVAAQFDLPFGTTAAQSIDDLLVIVLAALAGAHLVYVVTGRRDTAPVLLVVAAAIGAHLFIPGRGKVLLGWLPAERLGNVPLNGWVTGWMGQTDGGFARWLADVTRAVDLPLRVTTVVVELGAVVAVVHHRLLRLWLPLVIVFHLANFAFFGFWFLGWIVVELALLVVLWRRDLAGWVAGNATPARGALAAVAVAVGGAVLFHPPGLAWFDTPVAYGLEVEAEGVSGRRYHVPIAAFAPFEQEVAFTRVQLGPTRHLVGSYGVVATSDRLAELEDLDDLDDVAAREEPRTGDESARSERFFQAFMVNANRRASRPGPIDRLSPVAPVTKYWTGRPAPTYHFQEPLVRLEVVRLTSLQSEDRHLLGRQPVLVLAAEDGADPRVVAP